MPKCKQKDKLILACDLSLNGSAFAVLEVYKNTLRVVEMAHVDNSKLPADNLPEKLANIYFTLDDIMQRNKVTHIVRERGFSRFNNATRKLGRVEGVVDFTLYCHEFKKTMQDYTPSDVKKTITGNGRASKEEVATEVKKYLVRGQKYGLEFENDDLSDAVAIGVTYAIKNKLITVDK